MLFLTIAAFGVLLAYTYLASRDLLFPPVILCATWLLSLAAVAASGDTLLPVSTAALLVYLVGATAFCVAGLLVFHRSDEAGTPRALSGKPRRLTRLGLDLALVALVLGLPAYWSTLSASLGEVDLARLLYEMRAAEVERSDLPSQFSMIINLNIVAQFAALALVFETDGSWSRRWRAILAVILALVYGGMTGAKVFAVSLLIGLFFVASLRARKVTPGVLVSAVTAALLLFTLGLLAVNFVGAQFDTAEDVLGALTESFQLYWLSGIVAFSAVAENPYSITSTLPIHRFFLETGRSLGFAVDVPPKHAEYVNYTSTQETNVFTIYFSYFKDYGWTGTILLMAIVGIVLTLVYVRARRQDPLAIIMLGYMSVGLVLSVSSEHFFTAINRLIKLFLFLWVLYRALPAIELHSGDAAHHA